MAVRGDVGGCTDSHCIRCYRSHNHTDGAPRLIRVDAPLRQRHVKSGRYEQKVSVVRHHRRPGKTTIFLSVISYRVRPMYEESSKYVWTRATGVRGEVGHNRGVKVCSALKVRATFPNHVV